MLRRPCSVEIVVYWNFSLSKLPIHIEQIDPHHERTSAKISTSQNNCHETEGEDNSADHANEPRSIVLVPL